MLNSNEKELNRRKRGQIVPADLTTYIEVSTEVLIEMLYADDPQERTIAATILGNRKDEKGIIPLCNSLEIEKALYSRIAMSEALGKMGSQAVQPLIRLLGQIGNNQEVCLPKKYFNKKSYSLTRDMAARTLIKIGNPATPYLISALKDDDHFIIQQAVDALGGIAAKTGDKRALPKLINGLERYSDNTITIWKVIRALSGFKYSVEPLDPLLKVLNSDCDAAVVWEAARTLGQLGANRPDVIDALNKLGKNDHPEIRKAAKNALINIE